MNIKITRLDGGLHIDKTPEYLIKYLRYNHRTMDIVNYKKVPVYTERLLHRIDGKGGAFTLQGYFEHICGLIHKNNDTFIVVDDRTPLPDIDWEAVKAVGPRDYQIDAIIEFLTKGLSNSGIINAPGGYGKTFCQAFTYAAWGKLNTILAIPLKQVFDQTYEKFCKIFPDKHIGRVGGGYHDISTEITITTFKSLDKCATEKCEMLLIDELQGCSGDTIQNVITSIKPKRVFGFSATDEGLFNGADKLIKGLFGERLIYIPYDEALEMGAVVPGMVYFVKVPDCIISAKSFDGALLQGVKRCKPRNQLIAKAIASVPKDWATLTFIDHIQDHLVDLYPLMPAGTKYVHRCASKAQAGSYALTAKQQKSTTDDFTNNRFQHLIATDAFRAGVDIPHLRVVCQASGGASKIEVIQEALRGSRTLPADRMEELGITEEKTHFVLIDFLDNHDERLSNLAQKRRKHYEEQGWTVRVVDKIEDIDWKNHEPDKL
jgi:superfamily II DNA or RNA helicase